ncbi:TonB-dependent receptor domain-containing protein [Sphingomonas sp. Leaf343]|uniref:TonB-dependent receptor domain-containing protein n=1 Tax=Sphingomonas sp. Leaf343 TaxID=1736345 RepID=UPI0009E727E5|nr:TonB-dependent receptor [Sphingomonas sp. Leaf343]
MKHPIHAFLLATTMLAPTAAFARAAPAAPAGGQSGAPAGSVVSPQAGQPAIDAADPAAAAEGQQDQVEVSTPGGANTDDIVVVGRNIPNVVRATPEVINVLSTADIARTGEGDIAGALSRVTGLSVVGNGFVYVRGLGDRYSSSLLNGSPLPSPEPLRRVVPLDIFPTNVIASALVQKSYSVNYPAEFGGGVINLTTKAVPDETFFQMGGSVGADTVTTSELGYVYDGGSRDWTGYDSGVRKTPGFITAAGQNGTSLTSSQITGLNNAQTTLLQRNNQLPANLSGELSLGSSIDIGTVRVGAIAAAGISNTWRTRDITQQSTDDPTGILLQDFRTVLTDNRAVVNGLLGFGAEFGENKIRWTNLYLHDTVKQGRLSRGSTANVGVGADGIQPFLVQNTNWFERELFDTQLVGEFKLSDQFSLDARGAYAKTSRNSPYERAFTYQYNAAIGDYQNNLSGLQSASIAFSELDETQYSGQGNLTWNVPFDRPFALSVGYAYTDTSRDSTRYTFQYTGPNNGPVLGAAPQLRPDYLLSDYIIQAYGIGLRNTSTGQGAAAYSALLRVHGAYAQVEGEITDGLRATTGVRYETATERVNPSGGATGTSLKNDYWLPAVTVTWNFAPDMQLRAHMSKTLARPQFRELAQQLYQDFESDRLFFGNTFLKDSQLYNGELRYEYYFAKDQRVSLAGFYKRIDNPIEAVAFFAAGASALQTSFANAPRAKLYGGEVELQKYVPLDALGSDFLATRRLVAIVNYTYTKSSIDAGNQLIASPLSSASSPVLTPANILFQDGAALVGQSDHLVNLQLGIEDKASLSQFTVLFNYASNRVTNRGPIGGGGGTRLPDLIEKPGIRLDLVARQGIKVLGSQFEIKAEARNLTGTGYREFQAFDGTTVDINRYKLGRTFTLGASVQF